MSSFQLILIFCILWIAVTLAGNDPVIFEPIVLVHGGVGKVNQGKITKVLRGVQLAAKIGYQNLLKGGSAVSAVEAAIRSMEIDDDYNAGYGSVLTLDGRVENDASIMDGKSLKAGCVSLITDIMHPISVARAILEKLPYTHMAGEHAMKFAEHHGIEILQSGALISETAKVEWENYKKHLDMATAVTPSFNTSKGTVGAVAIDAFGNLAAGTSTGGSIGKLPGRIGDSSLLGSGTYADNNLGAISVTGGGEHSVGYNVAQRIMQDMNYRSATAQEAAEKVLSEFAKRLNAQAGVIVIDKYGGIGIHFTTETMPWAFQKKDKIVYGINKGEHFDEDVK